MSGMLSSRRLSRLPSGMLSSRLLQLLPLQLLPLNKLGLCRWQKCLHRGQNQLPVIWWQH